jgi:general nucleoside transport system permease protein
MIRLERRPSPSRFWSYMTPVVAVIMTVAAGAVLFWALGYPAGEALYQFFVTPLETGYMRAELLVKATPLVLIGVGLAIGFRAGVWNIGAEGQLLMGSLGGGAVALAFWNEDVPGLMVLMLVAGALSGAAFGAIPALLKTHFNVNEILSSLMLTYVAGLIISIMIYGPLRDPQGYGFPQSRMFHDPASLAPILEGTRLHLGALIALVVVLLAWLALARSLFGFQVKVIGQAPQAARYAGFSQPRMVWIGLLLGGGLAGLAGVIEVAGPVGQLNDSISPGYGFTAIIVAFLGRLHPVGVAIAGVVIALSYIGGENAQIMVGMPLAVTGVFQGMLLFFLLGSDLLIRDRIRLRHPIPHAAAGPAAVQAPSVEHA